MSLVFKSCLPTKIVRLAFHQSLLRWLIWLRRVCEDSEREEEEEEEHREEEEEEEGEEELEEEEEEGRSVEWDLYFQLKKQWYRRMMSHEDLELGVKHRDAGSQIFTICKYEKWDLKIWASIGSMNGYCDVVYIVNTRIFVNHKCRLKNILAKRSAALFYNVSFWSSRKIETWKVGLCKINIRISVPHWSVSLFGRSPFARRISDSAHSCSRSPCSIYSTCSHAATAEAEKGETCREVGSQTRVINRLSIHPVRNLSIPYPLSIHLLRVFSILSVVHHSQIYSPSFEPVPSILVLASTRQLAILYTKHILFMFTYFKILGMFLLLWCMCCSEAFTKLHVFSLASFCRLCVSPCKCRHLISDQLLCM